MTTTDSSPLPALARAVFDDDSPDPLRGADPTLVAVLDEVRRLAVQLGPGDETFRRSDFDRMLEAVRRLVDRRWGRGTLDYVGDPLLRVVHDPNRDAYLDDLAARVVSAWQIHAEDNSALAERVDRNGTTWASEKLYLARVGLLQAADDVHRPQTIRVGASWITEPDGTKAQVEPTDLLWVGASAYWYRSRAIAAAEAALRDDPWPDAGPTSIPLDDTLALDDVLPFPDPLAADPLLDLVASEERAALREALDAVALSPAERELAHRFLDSGDWSEAGDSLGLSSGATRTRKHRLLSKLEDADLPPL